MMAGERNADGFGNVFGQQLSARSESAGRENNFLSGDDAVVRFYSHHRAAGVPFEREHRRGEAYLDVFLPLHCREEKIGDGLILLPRV